MKIRGAAEHSLCRHTPNLKFLHCQTDFLSLVQSSSSLKASYEDRLASYGITISPFHVRWQTGLFNRLFYNWGRWKPRFLYLWYCFRIISQACIGQLLEILLYPAYSSYCPGTDCLHSVVCLNRITFCLSLE